MVEIFSRLNSRGTRVTEADIYLGVVAARNPGWVRDTFLPYLSSLADSGFDLDPNLLFRTLTGVGTKPIRFREIEESFWEPANVVAAWKRTADAWKRLVARFRKFGVLSSDPMPTQAALVTMIALVDKFDDSADFRFAFYWFLQASRFAVSFSICSSIATTRRIGMITAITLVLKEPPFWPSFARNGTTSFPRNTWPGRSTSN